MRCYRGGKTPCQSRARVTRSLPKSNHHYQTGIVAVYRPNAGLFNQSATFNCLPAKLLRTDIKQKLGENLSDRLGNSMTDLFHIVGNSAFNHHPHHWLCA